MNTVKDIYDLIIKERNKNLELKEISNDSKLSIMNGICYIVAVVIFSFKSILDVFAIDISTTLNNRINGTPVFYVNALFQYQKGDTLIVRDDGMAFGYASVDETKRIITQVSYEESEDENSLDNKLVMKVATGEKGKLSAISQEDLVLIRSYISKIKFAGPRVEVNSFGGDVLIPKVTVFYDGAVRESEVYDAIEEKLNEYIMNIEFDASIYVSTIIEKIKSVAHVTDVHIDPLDPDEQGIFIAMYNSDGYISKPQSITRMIKSNSGYIKQSTGTGEEKGLPNFRQSIKLVIGY